MKTKVGIAILSIYRQLFPRTGVAHLKILIYSRDTFQLTKNYYNIMLVQQYNIVWLILHMEPYQLYRPRKKNIKSAGTRDMVLPAPILEQFWIHDRDIISWYRHICVVSYYVCDSTVATTLRYYIGKVTLFCRIATITQMHVSAALQHSLWTLICSVSKFRQTLLHSCTSTCFISFF